MKEELVKEVWNKAEYRHRRRFPPQFVDYIYETVGKEPRGGITDEEWLEDLTATIDEKVETGQRVAGFLGLMSTIPKDSKNTEPKDRRRKWLARSFYLADFVISKSYKRGSLIDWKRTATEWNKYNPSDQISPHNLRIGYNRAMHKEDILVPLCVIKFKKLLAARWESLKKQLRYMQKHSPMSYALASYIGLLQEAAYKPLEMAIRNSPSYKAFKAYEAELGLKITEETGNMGNLEALIKDIQKEVNQNERTHSTERQP